VHVDPIEPTLKAPGTKLLKLTYDEPLPNFAFKFNLRRYMAVARGAVGRCRLPVSKPELKACLVSALETKV